VLLESELASYKAGRHYTAGAGTAKAYHHTRHSITPRRRLAVNR
jgi:hypothetical protein